MYAGPPFARTYARRFCSCELALICVDLRVRLASSLNLTYRYFMEPNTSTLRHTRNFCSATLKQGKQLRAFIVRGADAQKHGVTSLAVVTKLDTPKSDYRERTGAEWLVLGLGWD